MGAGTFVSAALPDAALRATPLLARARPGAPGPRSRWRPPPARDHGGLRPFRVSLPGLDAFPHETWARLVTRHARAHVPARMAYGDPAGAGGPRAAIADHVRVARGVRCEPEQVLVVPGSQAALRLCADVLLGPGERVVLEEPAYPGARAALGFPERRLVEAARTLGDVLRVTARRHAPAARKLQETT